MTGNLLRVTKDASEAYGYKEKGWLLFHNGQNTKLGSKYNIILSRYKTIYPSKKKNAFVSTYYQMTSIDLDR